MDFRTIERELREFVGSVVGDDHVVSAQGDIYVALVGVETYTKTDTKTGASTGTVVRAEAGQKPQIVNLSDLARSLVAMLPDPEPRKASDTQPSQSQ